MAVFAVPLIVLTTLLHRFGALETKTAIFLLGLSIALAITALLVGLAALAEIWRHGGRGTRHALFGIVIALSVLAWPLWRLSALVILPPINDVTTDWQDPPALRAAASLRPEGSNSPAYPGISFIEAQAEAYPEIVPFFLSYPAESVYRAARDEVAARGWQELLATPPVEGAAGHVEALAYTLIFGFQDDVSIRITPRGEGQSRVDMRSASRIGRHDLGENAERIYSFLTSLRNRLQAPVETEPGQEVATE